MLRGLANLLITNMLKSTIMKFGDFILIGIGKKLYKTLGDDLNQLIC